MVDDEVKATLANSAGRLQRENTNRLWEGFAVPACSRILGFLKIGNLAEGFHVAFGRLGDRGGRCCDRGGRRGDLGRLGCVFRSVVAGAFGTERECQKNESKICHGLPSYWGKPRVIQSWNVCFSASLGALPEGGMELICMAFLQAVALALASL